MYAVYKLDVVNATNVMMSCEPLAKDELKANPPGNLNCVEKTTLPDVAVCTNNKLDVCPRFILLAEIYVLPDTFNEKKLPLLISTLAVWPV